MRLIQQRFERVGITLQGGDVQGRNRCRFGLCAVSVGRCGGRLLRRLDCRFAANRTYAVLKSVPRRLFRIAADGANRILYTRPLAHFVPGRFLLPFTACADTPHRTGTARPCMTERLALFAHTAGANRRRDASGGTEMVRERRTSFLSAHGATARCRTRRFRKAVLAEIALFKAAYRAGRSAQASCPHHVVFAYCAGLCAAIVASCLFLTTGDRIHMTVDAAIMLLNLLGIQKLLGIEDILRRRRRILSAAGAKTQKDTQKNHAKKPFFHMLLRLRSPI